VVRKLLLSCEHGGNEVPAAYRKLFAGQRQLLRTHRGWDIGALDAARYLQRRLNAPFVAATVTRLLVDLNRTVGHARLYSEFTRGLSGKERMRILEGYYHPYRDLVAGWIGQTLAAGDSVLHVSVHSFTPVSNGGVRGADLGLLYDPGRRRESTFCRDWRAALAAQAPQLKVRCNYPYRGTADGFVTALRRQLPASRYVCMELEINQRLLNADRRFGRPLLRMLAATMPAP
jgi:predicted N-formylglutamate amidohydrolase